MPNTLGKRKHGDGDQEGADSAKPHGSTLFVSNLPYTATSVDLQTLFSDLAPVRSAFVVLDHDSGVSKGVGYVSFAIREDAQLVYDKVNDEGLLLVGRKLRVQFADNKPKEDEKPSKKPSSEKDSQATKKPRAPVSRAPHDPLAIRTIVVSGLPSSIDSKTIWKKVRKVQGAEKVEWPVDGEENTVAHVLFTTPAFALDAISKLHAHVFKGSLLSVALKKRLETLSKAHPTASTSSSTTTTTTTTTKSASKQKNGTNAGLAPSHASRLIVRNLPFEATEQDIRAVFLPYGPIYSIHMPLSELQTGEPKSSEHEDGRKNEEEETVKASYASRVDKKKKQTNKGFAFVWMLSLKDAERALEGCNGTKMRAGMADEMVRAKQQKKREARLEKKARAKANKVVKEEEGEEGDAKMDVDENPVEEEGEGEGEGKKNDYGGERVIAVDWALSKDRWEEEKVKAKDGKVVETPSSSSDSESNSDDDSDSSEEDSDDEESVLGVHDASSDDEDQEPVKPTLPPPETGTTLFVRNVPFEATEEDLRVLFRAFGPLRYARITVDAQTGRSRGTGFACFWNLEDADKVVRQSELLRAESGVVDTDPKKSKANPFKLPSILTPDPSSSLAQSLVLQGRTLDVVRAVTRDEAGKLKEEGERKREKADKRNLYLLREGVILPNTPAASTIPEVALERRTASYNARRALLRSNPALYISKTRLSVRQIPVFVTERMLRKLSTHAVKTFEAEVKAGQRTGLSADELAVDEEDKAKEVKAGKDEDEDEDEEKEKGKGKSKFFKGKKTGGLVKQAKIIRQAERVDVITGKGRSKGYGFIEMHTHANALRVLRWANNNGELGELWAAWWKEELEMLLKQVSTGGAKKEEGEETEATRIKKLKEELERVKSGKGVDAKGKGTLIVEFSIENVQVVQRRSAHQNADKSESRERRHKSGSESVKHEEEEESPKKRRRVSEPKVKKEEDEGDEKKKKLGNSMGSIIGRKRKQRQAGKR